ncbi:hypothetical protein [Reyranella soli]|uniref:Uncharacterized protein n=1 Tax=Reyranella soli TaxID=1230389 RepID=A0A512N8P0_9HYPH|nr:hypothetical protein [Reyranella soli]GEP55355.1 hypothetical protein RSO01_25210 [Reyranella soli]
MNSPDDHGKFRGEQLADIHLEAEWRRAIRQRTYDVRMVAPLERLGITPDQLPAVGVERVEFFGSGRAYYRPAENGRLALIVAVADMVSAPELGGMAEVRKIRDLVAVDIATRHVAIRDGYGTALGADNVADARLKGAPILLADTVLAWLRAPRRHGVHHRLAFGRLPARWHCGALPVPGDGKARLGLRSPVIGIA